jgi:transposase
MIGLGMSALKVYLAVEPCDMRKGFNGLATATVEHLNQPLATDALFVFINKRHTRVRLLCFDGTGSWLATKRLQRGTFSWPEPTLSFTTKAFSGFTVSIDRLMASRGGIGSVVPVPDVTKFR